MQLTITNIDPYIVMDFDERGGSRGYGSQARRSKRGAADDPEMREGQLFHTNVKL